MKMKPLLAVTVGLMASQFTFAAASPWLPAPGSLKLDFSQVEQTADEFYFADEEQPLPGDLSLSTSSLGIVYGLSERFALDARIGYASSDFDAPVENDSFSGTTDSTIGITWGITSEHASDSGFPSISARIGAIISGNYETGEINSIGDGANGIEASIAFGKVINSYLAFGSEIGYRDRTDDVPSEIFYNTNVYINFTPNLTAFGGYYVEDSRDGLQIGGDGFSPDRFPELEEDKEYIQLGGQYKITSRFSIALSAARVLDGRNTATSDIYALNIGYSL